MVRLALECIPDGVLVCDPAYRVLLANRKARAMLALPVGGSRMPAGTAGKLETLLHKLQAMGEASRPVLLVLLKPERLFIWIHASPVHGPSGELRGHVIELRDTTSNQDASRRSLEIASFIVHRFPELTEKLAGSLAQVPDPGLKGEMTTLHREIDRQVNKLVAFTELEAGPLRLLRMPLAVDDVLRDLVERHQPLAAERGLSFACALTCGDATVEADEDWLVRLFHILIENALGYCEGGKVVAVASEPLTGGRCRVVIENPVAEAPDADTVARLFDLRRQLSEFETSLGDDFSLELPLARHIVEAHGGRIEVTPDLAGVFRVVVEI